MPNYGQADPRYCKRCTKELSVNAGWNRKYCDDCQRLAYKESQSNKYQKRKEKDPDHLHKKKSCMVCGKKFLYIKNVTGSTKICDDCVRNFIHNVTNVKCLMCGKAIQWKHEGRGRFAFCSREHSIPAWYILRRYKKGTFHYGWMPK